MLELGPKIGKYDETNFKKFCKAGNERMGGGNMMSKISNTYN